MALSLSRRLLAQTARRTVQARRITSATFTPAAARWQSSQAVTRDAMTGELTSKPDIDASRLELVKNTSPKSPPSPQSLVFGHNF
ncbi:hypothetical protein FRB90_005758, partial [Tulasnella sp. 427]